ncbi:uncharacterized protein CC84DRAFT_1212625 [Paraphaeosphaeria sporulosa]|uniref:Uncharacterized protein n=1 Tax=Paraphaeosphaeria sporulosa TaxID=1460663 RepID=A0A177D0F8_9PLEO|nr:uncharacterized protein CC84DRAFT_1212625 [Paraphaeosphaeria sporulosa]OAG13183.1 hypothetical protein CC84DRAFT_1212625 [Paraphaeosphaeria sporulosa]
MESPKNSALTTLCDEETFKDFSDVESDDTTLVQLRSRSRVFRPVIILLSVILVLIPLIYFTVATPRRRLKYDQCGTTADEARARGCVFEITGFTWLPRECQDTETEDEFLDYLAENDLNIYRDTKYTDIVPIEEVRLGNGPGFFVRQQYHVTHCQFLLRKLHRAQTSGRMIDGQIMPTHHTVHCGEQTLSVIQDPSWREDAIQLSYTKFPYCGKPGGYNVGWDQDHGRPTAWTNA